MEYYKWNSRRFVPLRTNSPCYRCGQYHIAGHCCARLAQSNICTNWGNFAVMCWFKKDRHKSARSKQRDTERMTGHLSTRKLQRCCHSSESVPMNWPPTFQSTPVWKRFIKGNSKNCEGRLLGKELTLYRQRWSCRPNLRMQGTSN